MNELEHRDTSGSDVMFQPTAGPRAAYVHVPFCVHRCGYCNFSVVAGRDDLVDSYLVALECELRWLETPRPVDTLYFGGGTPTYLQVEQLQRLCETVLAWHPLADGYEWTVEANPGDLDAERLQVLADCGVNRLSLGGQSFHESKLRKLERDHAAADIRRSCSSAHNLGMAVSLDLIFAAPGEQLEEWQSDLARACQLQPEHISTYGLTFERGTQFWSRLQRGLLASVPEELEREMYLLAIDQLSAAGYEHYEISNFAQPGRRSRHNETYWQGQEYFAAGPGAARYAGGIRQTNHRSTTTYLRRVLAGWSPVAEEEQLTPESRARESLVFGLRKLAGVNRQEFAQHTGFTVDELAAEPLGKYVALGLLADDGEGIRLTREGLLVSDGLWPDFL